MRNLFIVFSNRVFIGPKILHKNFCIKIYIFLIFIFRMVLNSEQIDLMIQSTKGAALIGRDIPGNMAFKMTKIIS